MDRSHMFVCQTDIHMPVVSHSVCGVLFLVCDHSFHLIAGLQIVC